VPLLFSTHRDKVFQLIIFRKWQNVKPPFPTTAFPHRASFLPEKTVARQARSTFDENATKSTQPS
jgi:hypothetical protein